MIATDLDVNTTLDGKFKLILTLKDKPSMEQLQDLKAYTALGKQLDVEVKKFRKKRSLDANSYCWLLITKLADKLNTSKDELYIEMLKRYGQREPQLLSVVAEGAEMIYRATENHCVEVGESELKGKLFKHLAILIGSSNYNTKDMSALIEGIVSECKEQAIETISTVEYERMMAAWDGRK